MRNAEELIAAARIAMEENDFDEVVEILCEALGHIRDFSYRTGETWEWSQVRECCHEIGEKIHEKAGFDGMREVYTAVYYEMKALAARYLEKAWDGCGDGEWRG